MEHISAISEITIPTGPISRDTAIQSTSRSPFTYNYTTTIPSIRAVDPGGLSARINRIGGADSTRGAQWNGKQFAPVAFDIIQQQHPRTGSAGGYELLIRHVSIETTQMREELFVYIPIQTTPNGGGLVWDEIKSLNESRMANTTTEVSTYVQGKIEVDLNRIVAGDADISNSGGAGATSIAHYTYEYTAGSTPVHAIVIARPISAPETVSTTSAPDTTDIDVGTIKRYGGRADPTDRSVEGFGGFGGVEGVEGVEGTIDAISLYRRFVRGQRAVLRIFGIDSTVGSTVGSIAGSTVEGMESFDLSGDIHMECNPTGTSDTTNPVEVDLGAGLAAFGNTKSPALTPNTKAFLWKLLWGVILFILIVGIWYGFDKIITGAKQRFDMVGGIAEEPGSMMTVTATV
jgi:hypothetical protein